MVKDIFQPGFTSKLKVERKWFAVTLYFALSLFAIMGCEFMTAIQADKLLGNKTAQTVYSAYSVSVAAGVLIFYLFRNALKNQKPRKMTFISVCAAGMLAIVLQINVETPALFWVSTICLFALAGFNTGIASCCLFGLYRDKAAVGRILAVASLAGLSAHYALCRVLSGSPYLLEICAVFVSVSIAAMMFLLSAKVQFAWPETSAESGGSRRIAAVAAGVVLVSYIIGLSDSLVTQALPLHVGDSGSFFYPVLFYIPGQVIACLLVDIKTGKYVNLATFLSAVLLTPIALLLKSPEEVFMKSGLNFFMGGFFLAYIMTSVISVAHRSRNVPLFVCLPGMLYPLFCGIGGFFGPRLSASLDAFSVLAVYSAMLAVLALLTFGGVALERVPPDEKASKPVLARYRFTEREAEVLALLAEGMSSQAIAARLFISEKTVRNHVSNMMSKTDSASRTDLILLAKQ